MKYCFALILALAAMPLLAQPDATAKPEVEDSAKEADKTTDKLTPAQRLQQFLDTQTELNKEIVGEVKLTGYFLGIKAGQVTFNVTHDEYKNVKCYKVTANITIEFAGKSSSHNGTIYCDAKLQVLHQEEKEIENGELIESKTRTADGDEVVVHIIDKNNVDEAKRDITYRRKKNPLCVNDMLLPLLLANKPGTFEGLYWDNDDKKFCKKTYKVEVNKDSESIWSSKKESDDEDEKPARIVVSDGKIVQITLGDLPFVFTSKPTKETKSLPLDEVRKLDTPVKAAIGFFVGLALQDKALVEDAVNQLEYARHIVSTIEECKEWTAEEREDYAKEVAETLINSFVKSVEEEIEKNEKSKKDVESGVVVFCCPEFYVVEQVLDVWIIKIKEEAKEFIPVEEYRVIKNKKTGKYEVAAAIFADDDDEATDSDNKPEEQPEEKGTTE